MAGVLYTMVSLFMANFEQKAWLREEIGCAQSTFLSRSRSFDKVLNQRVDGIYIYTSLETRPSPSSTRACSVRYNYAREYFRRVVHFIT